MLGNDGVGGSLLKRFLRGQVGCETGGSGASSRTRLQSLNRGREYGLEAVYENGAYYQYNRHVLTPVYESSGRLVCRLTDRGEQ